MAEVGLIWADDADLQAIYTYVQNQRPQIRKFPKLQAAIEDFERWYQQLGWMDVHVMIDDTVAEAARRRNEINQIMNQVLPADWIPADKRVAQPGSASKLPGPEPEPEPWIPEKYKFAAAIGAGVTAVVAAVITVKKFLP